MDAVYAVLLMLSADGAVDSVIVDTEEMAYFCSVNRAAMKAFSHAADRKLVCMDDRELAKLLRENSCLADPYVGEGAGNGYRCSPSAIRRWVNTALERRWNLWAAAVVGFIGVLWLLDVRRTRRSEHPRHYPYLEDSNGQ